MSWQRHAEAARHRAVAAPAWDIDGYTRDFQAAPRVMWRELCSEA